MTEAQVVHIGLDETLVVDSPIGPVRVSCIADYCGLVEAFQPVVVWDPQGLASLNGLETLGQLKQGIHIVYSDEVHQEALDHRLRNSAYVVPVRDWFPAWLLRKQAEHARDAEIEPEKECDVTKDKVALEFEAAIPLLGDGFRTKLSRAGRTPYVELVEHPDGYRIDRFEENGDIEALTDALALRDMHFVLTGIMLSDQLQHDAEPSA